MIADLDDGIGVVVLINGIAESYGAVPIALHSLGILRAGLRQQELPSPPSVADPALVSNVDDYAGSYISGDDQMVFTATGEQLTLRWQGQEAVLERRGEDSFYVSGPELELFLLEFGRDEGRVVELFHGTDWYVGEGYSGPRNFDYPNEWESYQGHYRTYNFGLTNFRVVLRKGALLLIYPSGGHEILTPLGDGLFHIGEDPRSPETMRFDSIASGQALRATYSGCPYYRTYNP